jgi:biotin-dependent carboxylase-like uncharacterized protein
MSLQVLEVGASVLVQDRGRPGWAHLGVPRSGALDGPAAALANRLVGNHDDAACLEVLMGGLVASCDAGVWVAVTGATCRVAVDDHEREHGAAVRLPAGSTLRLGRPPTGLRSYVAVAGGLAVDPVLGSRSSDTLGRVGPPPVAPGDRLPVGPPIGPPAAFDAPRPPRAGPLRVTVGPRADRVTGDALDLLCRTSYTVSPDSDRVGLRLVGDAIPQTRDGELPSEGLVLGAVQLPPDGQPVVFLADHPTTGGYPVVAVVDERDLWQCAQMRPGERLTFTRAATR